jgi:hypothetical protein
LFIRRKTRNLSLSSKIFYWLVTANWFRIHNFKKESLTMASDRQIAANRANAAKSTGPRSSKGRGIAARNGTRHGMLARTIVLEGESPNRFMLLLGALQDEFQPQTCVQRSLVETMAVARWRQMRLWAIEKAGISHEIRQRESIAENSGSADQDAPTRAALAFQNLGDKSRFLELMNRYETRYDHQFTRALDRLLRLREKSDFAKRTQFE